MDESGLPGPGSRAVLVLDRCGQILTMAGDDAPRRGPRLGEVGLVPDGALAVDGAGNIIAAGSREKVLPDITVEPDATVMDVGGGVVMPGFVDPHTHAVFPEFRSWEYEARVGGKSYLDITRDGGGIGSSVRSLRQMEEAELLERSKARVGECLAEGTTTIEIKSGYGLSLEHELKMLRVVRALDESLPARVVSTFLGAHAVPDDFEGDVGGYVRVVVEEMIPAVAAEGLATFNDVFCDVGFFDLEQSRTVLNAGLKHGLRPKIHADELKELGAARLAAELGAMSADHLTKTGADGMKALAKSQTVGVLLPGTSFGLASKSYPSARPFIESGVAVALATDFNPGSSACQSMQAIIGLACSMMGMSPAEAVTASTHNAACALGLSGEVGSLTPGKRADLIVLDVEDFREIPYRFGKNHVREVYVGGRSVAGRS